jgi:DNA repair protein SbcD/Mre11
VKVLHTSDWHVGKLLRGMSRVDEHRAVLGEIAEVASREKVDLALVVGDLFETMAPSADAVAVVWDALLALRESGAHVVVVGGNHDQQAQLESVAPVFARLGITVLGLPAPRERAVLDVAGARVVMMPWVSQRWAIKSDQLMGATASETVQYYAARVRRLLDWYTEGFALDTVNIVAAHCMVQGGVLGGGERDAQLIDEYAVPSAAFPASANYVALGHLHRTQQIPGAAPIWYSGSPIQVDFGEEADVKHALLVDIPERGGAKVTPVPLTRGWTLRTVRGTFEELEAIAGSTGDAWLRVVVSEPARPGLADDVRELLPQAVDVRITSPATQASDERAIPTRTHAAPRELFGSYLDWEQRARDERLLALFDDLLDADTQPTEVG